MQFVSRSVHETEALGHKIGRLLRVGDIVCLSGELGAGKTALTRGLAAGWGTMDSVTSPTYTLVNVYTRSTDSTELVHIDAYRLQSVDDAYSIAIDDLLSGENAIVIEWPQRIEEILPADRLTIILVPLSPDERQITIQAAGPQSARLLAGVTTE